MPGYKALPAFVKGNAADQVREAEARHRIGDSIAAVAMLEEALAASIRANPVYPGWLCGRLAALYRTLGRYDDEVNLLERYRDSQTSEEARTRYDARLCKARTIAERKRRTQSGALESVRASLGRPRTRRPRRVASAAEPTVKASSLDALSAALHAPEDIHESVTRIALERLTAEAHAARTPVELLVSALKTAASAENGLSPDQVSARYSAALVHLLALYFEEPAE
jgi:hypothetical protein